MRDRGLLHNNERPKPHVWLKTEVWVQQLFSPCNSAQWFQMPFYNEDTFSIPTCTVKLIFNQKTSAGKYKPPHTAWLNWDIWVCLLWDLCCEPWTSLRCLDPHAKCSIFNSKRAFVFGSVIVHDYISNFAWLNTIAVIWFIRECDSSVICNSLIKKHTWYISMWIYKIKLSR